MTVRVYIPETPLGNPDDWCDVAAGQTIAEICGTSDITALVDGHEVTPVFINGAKLKDGVVVVARPTPQAAATLAIAGAIASGAGASAAAAGAWWAAAGYCALPIALTPAHRLTE